MSKKLPLVDQAPGPWYKDGLKFGCTQCGKCCTGSPGYVWIDENEIASLAETLKITTDEFIKRYTRSVGNRLALREYAKNYDCVFLKEGKYCQVYQARPKQCRTFPWWPENLASKKDWEETANRCEGINNEDAPIVPFSEIQKQLKIMIKPEANE